MFTLYYYILRCVFILLCYYVGDGDADEHHG
jgi:hypothetical protein